MADLERELRDAAAHVEWPSDDVSVRVAARLRAGAAAPHKLRRRWVLVPALAASVAVIVAVTAIVVRDRDHPAVPRRAVPTTVPSGRDLGKVVSLSEARSAVGINVLVPTITGMTEPDEVRVTQRPTSGQVALVYRSRAGLPSADKTGIGMVIAMFKGQLDTGSFVKLLGVGTRVTPTTVQGVTGYWIDGAPHAFGYVDEAGRIEAQSFRLASNVLLWQRNGLTLRIESALTRDQAVRVADSMR